MEALYACLVDGNNMDSEWWGDFACVQEKVDKGDVGKTTPPLLKG